MDRGKILYKRHSSNNGIFKIRCLSISKATDTTFSLCSICKNVHSLDAALPGNETLVSSYFFKLNYIPNINGTELLSTDFFVHIIAENYF
jgi:hypothetical protein